MRLVLSVLILCLFAAAPAGAGDVNPLAIISGVGQIVGTVSRAMSARSRANAPRRRARPKLRALPNCARPRTVASSSRPRLASASASPVATPRFTGAS